MKLLKSEVDKALSNMEMKLFGKDQQDNPNLTPVLRMMNLFAEAYYQDSYPEESIILRMSWQLLKEKGYYYTHED